MNRLLAVLRKQRDLDLRVVVGMSAEETAEAIGSTAGAVRVAQHRALARLRPKSPRRTRRYCLTSDAGLPTGVTRRSTRSTARTASSTLASRQPVYSTDPARPSSRSCSPGGATNPAAGWHPSPRDGGGTDACRRIGANAPGRRWPGGFDCRGSVVPGGFGAVVAGAGRATRCTACTRCCSASSSRRAPIRWRSPRSSWPRYSS